MGSGRMGPADGDGFRAFDIGRIDVTFVESTVAAVFALADQRKSLVVMDPEKDLSAVRGPPPSGRARPGLAPGLSGPRLSARRSYTPSSSHGVESSLRFDIRAVCG